MTGDDLKAWRTARGLTQQQLAERAGVTANTVARWERGEIQITMMAENTLRWVEVDLHMERRAESRRSRRRYRARQRRRVETETPAPPAEQTLTIDATRLRQLLQLVHPDKHNGSKTATDVTAWLLSEVPRR